MPLYSWERDKNAILEKMKAPDVLKLCAKVLDEPLLVEGWIEHHAKIVGYQNLIIADNMSADLETLSIYRKYADDVTIFQFSGPHNQIHWHPRFQDFFATINDSCRFFLFCDVDERLIQISNDAWVAESAIIERLLDASGTEVIPTTWIVNKLNSFDTFCLGGASPYISLSENLKWGKPILPAQLVGSQPGIHNVQYEDAKFVENAELDLFLLHLTQFPARRISTNRNKLISRGIIDPCVSSEQILQMDFSGMTDRSFLPLVDEIRRMSDILSNPEQARSFPVGAEICLEQNGYLSYSSSLSKDLLHEYKKESANLLRSTFRGIRPSVDNLDKPEFALAIAMDSRARGHLARAERLFRIGIARHPHLPGKFGGPAFRKELVRMFLAQQEWSKADELVSQATEQDSWAGTHWHEILYARAFTQVGDHERGLIWWTRVLSREPMNGEAVQQGRLLRERIEQQSFETAKIALRDDLIKVKLDLDKSQNQIHGFMAKFFEITKMDVGLARANLDEMVASAQARISHLRDGQAANLESTIPRVIHRIWLTSPSAPSEPPTRYIESMLQEAEEYAKRGWNHYLWTQDIKLIPETVAQIEKRGVSIKVLSVDDDLPDGDWRRIFGAFVADRKFPFAADILRMKALYEFGGIYADMGARFRSERLASIVAQNFDLAFIFWDTMFFQNSLMAMPKKSILGEKFMRLAEKPNSIPRSLLEPLTGISEGMAFSGLMITAILLKIYSRSMHICALAPNARAIEWSSEKSWYTDSGNQIGKFGNAYVPSTSPSFFRHDASPDAEEDELFGEAALAPDVRG